MKSNLIGLFLELLFPKKCVGCGRFGNYFCNSCITNIKQGDLVCPKCEKLSLGGMVHPVCRRKYGLDGLWSLGLYQDSLKSAVGQLKYRWVKDLAEVLVDITLDYWVRCQPFLLDEIKKSKGLNWVVVPVPLHPRRRRERGFNQAEFLSWLLAEKLGLEYREALKRIRYTKPQVKLKSWDRRQNIKGAFSLISSMNNELQAINIILVDDVWTTGSTLKECCFVLKKAGAKKVWALTLAR